MRKRREIELNWPIMRRAIVFALIYVIATLPSAFSHAQSGISMKVTLLGTSGPIPHPMRMGPSTLVEA